MSRTIISAEDMARHVEAGMSDEDIARAHACRVSYVSARRRALRLVSKAPAVKTYGEDVKAEAREMWDRGESMRQIAQALGTTTQTVANWLHQAGVPLRERRSVDKEQVVKLHGKGFTVPEIAASLGCADSTIYRIVRDHKVLSSAT